VEWLARFYLQPYSRAQRNFFCYSRGTVDDVFYLIVFVQIVLGCYALWEGAQWLAMVRRRLRTPPGFYSPRVAVICPCKGLEPHLEENLTALTELDYSNYELFVVVASEGDPALGAARKLSEGARRRVHTVVAGPAADSGEKVNNLRVAAEKVPPEFEVFVFVDSDGRPGRAWLQRLVAPLGDPRLGAATTFRWYLPDRGGFWSALAAAWNAAIVTQLGEHNRNFCWGGGTAIRRSVFEQARVAESWQGSVSDDYSMTRALRQAGRRIHFVPECLVPALHDTDFHGLIEFTNRQIIITRVYAPNLWALALAAHGFYCVAVLLGLGLLLGSWLSGGIGFHILLLVLAVPLLAGAKGYLRLMAVVDLLPAWKGKLLQYGWAWTLLAALVPFVYFWNSLVAMFTRRIIWRGALYELISPDQTRIL